LLPGKVSLRKYSRVLTIINGNIFPPLKDLVPRNVSCPLAEQHSGY
jgi:hypothetical protein